MLSQNMRVQLIAKREADMTGTSRYSSDLYRGFREAEIDAQLTFPARTMLPSMIHNSLKNFRLDLETFFASYPLRVKLDHADIYHLTAQMLATLLHFQSFPKPVVVTVLDIIPYLVKHQPELNTLRHLADYSFYRMALAGLQRANVLIAISNYTRQTLVEVLKLPAEQIHVIYPGIDHVKFRPLKVPDSFLAKYGLDQHERYVLFVGSEDPRKNLSTLIQAFALVKQQTSNLKLLKVGAAHYTQERQKLIALISALGLEKDVLFLNYVPDEDLPFFYNEAEALVMPSHYEGFGLPVVEAMACGTPVVCTRGGSLPEVTGEAGVQVDPHDVEGMAKALLTILESPSEKLRLKEAGQEQAAKFTQQRMVCATRELYEKIIQNPNGRKPIV